MSCRRRDRSRCGSKFWLWLALGAGLAAAACSGRSVPRDLLAGHVIEADAPGWLGWSSHRLAARIEMILEAARSVSDRRALVISHPYDDALFPRDLAAPDFAWQEDGQSDARSWLVRLILPDTANEIRVLCGRPRWRPDEPLWALIKQHSLGGQAALTVYGVSADDQRVVSSGTARFGTSADPVGGGLFFQQIPLPFAHAFKNTHEFRWLVADLTRPEPPRVVLTNPPACALCHTFSADGSTFGLDMDVRGDKGGYLIAPVAARTRLARENLISWNDLAVVPGLPNMGLFAKLSPDGRYALASVGEKPFMAVLDHVDFSQLFFPISGRLAWYDRRTRAMGRLPGADDARYVQASPAWSPDGETVYFARAPVDLGLHGVMGSRRLLPVPPGTDIHALNARYRIRFDIYRLPFAAGRGGEALPLAGASGNGRSNFFPRVSPDGRWIVFTQSATGMVGQPDSRLMIVAAAGGVARPMRCNTRYYNSWHSWSPNGRWIVFTSKVNTPYTELFLAHVDPDGQDSPPVWLSRLSHPRRAALIPEFVNRDPATIQSMVFAVD